MDLKAKLQEARDLISDRSRWITGRHAVDRQGYSIIPTSDMACKWCARGALFKVFGIDAEHFSIAPEESRAAYVTVRNTLDACANTKHSEKSFVGVNDSIGHAAIIEVFDCAIAKHS